MTRPFKLLRTNFKLHVLAPYTKISQRYMETEFYISFLDILFMDVLT